MNICVFCGSATGTDPVHAQSARALGMAFAKSSHTLVYGGGNIGLMGVVADAVLENGGKAIGVIPDFLMQREVGHRNLTQLEVVGTMHERKKRMADLSDAFIALPGGWGTLDELAEILTWRQLGLIHQPIAILNIQHFFDPLVAQMRSMVSGGFLKHENLDFLIVENDVEKILSRLFP
ncbi:TIGR00730 family Rossman fold protein [Chryseolinea lacunae]|uniref:Cytokinin riboside 5'-monophosphate phosphoribohydrolase n=1 Tax=Chryseolinea lacunae TaxID=2801331 RepID=A0ABS1KQD8_9BACT|nr:TIGR00730 family Rossman fold protein [Chryseolinea lacunae]